MTRKFINDREVLLIHSRYGDGIRIDETDILAKTYDTIEDVVALLNDEVVKVIRFDTEDPRNSEDITDDLAQAYLDNQTPYLWDASTLPEYVQESLSWENYCEEANASRIDPVAEHGTYHVHGGRVVG